MLQSVNKLKIATQAIGIERGEKDIQIFEIGNCCRCLEDADGRLYLKTGLCEKCRTSPTSQDRLRSVFGARDALNSIKSEIGGKSRKRKTQSYK